MAASRSPFAAASAMRRWYSSRSKRSRSCPAGIDGARVRLLLQGLHDLIENRERLLLDLVLARHEVDVVEDVAIALLEDIGGLLVGAAVVVLGARADGAVEGRRALHLARDVEHLVRLKPPIDESAAGELLAELRAAVALHAFAKAHAHAPHDEHGADLPIDVGAQAEAKTAVPAEEGGIARRQEHVRKEREAERAKGPAKPRVLQGRLERGQAELAGIPVDGRPLHPERDVPEGGAAHVGRTLAEPHECHRHASVELELPGKADGEPSICVAEAIDDAGGAAVLALELDRVLCVVGKEVDLEVEEEEHRRVLDRDATSPEAHRTEHVARGPGVLKVLVRVRGAGEGEGEDHEALPSRAHVAVSREVEDELGLAPRLPGLAMAKSATRSSSGPRDRFAQSGGHGARGAPAVGP